MSYAGCQNEWETVDSLVDGWMLVHAFQSLPIFASACACASEPQPDRVPGVMQSLEGIAASSTPAFAQRQRLLALCGWETRVMPFAVGEGRGAAAFKAAAATLERAEPGRGGDGAETPTEHEQAQVPAAAAVCHSFPACLCGHRRNHQVFGKAYVKTDNWLWEGADVGCRCCNARTSSLMSFESVHSLPLDHRAR